MQHISRTDVVHPGEREKTPSRRELNKQIQKTLYVPFIGVLGVLLAQSVYPLLDRPALSVLVVVLFLLPFAVHIVSSVRKRLAANIGLLRRVYGYCGAVLIGLAASLGLNGWLDRAPVQFVRTSIIQKHVTRLRDVIIFLNARKFIEIFLSQRCFLHCQKTKYDEHKAYVYHLSIPSIVEY